MSKAHEPSQPADPTPSSSSKAPEPSQPLDPTPSSSSKAQGKRKRQHDDSGDEKVESDENTKREMRRDDY